MAEVICPHCGARNPKSFIVTTCSKCLQSLDGAEPAPREESPEFDTPPPPAPVGPPDQPVPPPTWDAPEPDEFDEPSPVGEPVPEPRGFPPTVKPQAAPPPMTSALPQPPGGAKAGPVCGIVLGIGALTFVAFFFIAILMRRSVGPGVVVPFVLIGGVVVLIIIIAAVVLIRKKIRDTFYDALIDPDPRAGVGEAFDWGVTVRAKRPITVGTASVTLKCQEHAIARGGTSDSHYRKTLVEQTFQVAGKQLMPGEELPLRVTASIPRDAIPSHASKNNFIEWTLQIRASVPGYCPDLKESISVTVEPTIAGGQGLAESPSVSADWLTETHPPGGHAQLGAAWATLEAEGGATLDQAPVMAVGETRRFRLWVQTNEALNGRGVLCWVGCRIHGSGTDEEITLHAEQTIHEGALNPGQPVSFPIEVSVPGSGPVSYVGRYVKLEWVVRVRIDIPLWFDKRMYVPFIVTPRRGE